MDKGISDGNASNIKVDLEHLYSPYAILVDADSGAVLSEYGAQTRIYPASLTKIMTAVLAVENIDDMEETMMLPTDFFQELYQDGFTFYSTMFQYMDRAEIVGGTIIGGKTGYTEEAGLCLTSLAEIEGKEYILVTAKASGSPRTEPYHILDAVNVYGQIGTY